MRFSVVIPTFNRKHSLQHCLRAVTSQAYPDYEVIVVDDGSRDGTLEMVRSEFPKVICLQTGANCGPAAARNRGIQAAGGDIIAFTDDDCVPPRDWLSNLAAGFEAYPEAGAVGGIQEPPEETWKRNITARFERYNTRNIYQLGDKVKIGYPLHVGTNNLAVRKQQIQALGGFDEEFPVAAGEDADLLDRFARAGKPTVCLPMQVVHRREYTWPAFVSQQIQRGVGAAYFAAKRRNLRRPAWEAVRLIALPILFWVDLFHSRSFSLAMISVASRFFQALGRIKAYPRASALVPHAEEWPENTPGPQMRKNASREHR